MSQHATFRNISILFVLSFKKDYDYPAKNPFNKHYTTLVEIEDFNALIDNKPFFDQHVKKQEAYEKLVEMSRNNDYTTGNLLLLLSLSK